MPGGAASIRPHMPTHASMELAALSLSALGYCSDTSAQRLPAAVPRPPACHLRRLPLQGGAAPAPACLGLGRALGALLAGRVDGLALPQKGVEPGGGPTTKRQAGEGRVWCVVGGAGGEGTGRSLLRTTTNSRRS